MDHTECRTCVSGAAGTGGTFLKGDSGTPKWVVYFLPLWFPSETTQKAHLEKHPGGICVQCLDGQQNSVDFSICLECPTGTAGTSGFCSPCPEGTQPDENRQTCEPCLPGFAGQVELAVNQVSRTLCCVIFVQASCYFHSFLLLKALWACAADAPPASSRMLRARYVSPASPAGRGSTARAPFAPWGWSPPQIAPCASSATRDRSPRCSPRLVKPAQTDRCQQRTDRFAWTALLVLLALAVCAPFVQRPGFNALLMCPLSQTQCEGSCYAQRPQCVSEGCWEHVQAAGVHVQALATIRIYAPS